MGKRISDIAGVQREYDWVEIEPAVAVLESIAVFEHGDVTEAASVLETPLATHIEADALNTLVRNGSMTSISFRIADYHVQIHRNSVEVTRAER